MTDSEDRERVVHVALERKQATLPATARSLPNLLWFSGAAARN